ncbi:PREDICTED: phenolic glucoside malonyltransferase 2-like [Tarenaya hassleriana]|uniref:phenolic glucoside malonyltransferase 2-like n=1 Tax=Tarenaya hassleriana TaxID=28532 RepID=UPI00053C5A8C|nr:PREDICTED: phenolic glucoside malonyltransferase 2-like [Tarenaya hassleriana]
MALKVIEFARVSPAQDSTRGSAYSLNLPLIFFDLPWLRFHPVERVFFYRLTDSTRELFESVILPRLKHSLSGVLRHFLPLAGRITWDPQEPKPSIVVSENDTVSLTVAVTGADLSRVSGNGQRQESELRLLVPELPVSDDSASVVSLQITLFPSQGFCIGMAGHHAVLDGKTASMFIKAWAHTCKQHQEHENIGPVPLPDDLTPSFDRSLIKDLTNLDAKMLELLSSFTQHKTLKLFSPLEIGPDVVRVTLELTRQNIEKLRERVKNELPSHQGHHLSSFVIAYAYLWTCFVNARGGDAHRPVALIFVADYRHRFDPPLPATYFGNCIYPVICHDKTAGAFMEEKGFGTAVQILSDMVKSLESRRMETIPEEFEEGFKSARRVSQLGSAAGSTRLGIYGSDFGWGRPDKVEIISIDQSEAFSMAEKRDGEVGGIEMGLCLEKREMDKVVSLFNDGLN